MLSKIRDNLFICGEVDIKNAATNPENNITVIFNIADNCKSQYFPSIKTIEYPFEDDPSKPTSIIEAEKSAEILKELLADGEVVLIHCQAGCSRSPHVLTLALADIENREYDELYEEVKKMHPGAAEESWKQRLNNT
tara:strand:+ start:318 stop:728 length:411 start_codon:yes stop_codon:yes gene_type:complete